jgi:hypothetical protein
MQPYNPLDLPNIKIMTGSESQENPIPQGGQKSESENIRDAYIAEKLSDLETLARQGFISQERVNPDHLFTCATGNNAPYITREELDRWLAANRPDLLMAYNAS